MTLATTVGSLPAKQTHNLIIPVQLLGRWIVLHDLPNTADAATITDPDTEIAGADNRIYTVHEGTRLKLRLRYDDADTQSTDPVVKVFGRFNDGTSADPWENLVDLCNSLTSALAVVEATDVSDGTNNWTAPHVTSNTFNLNGCNQVLVGVQTALVLGGGPTYASARIEGKFI